MSITKKLKRKLASFRRLLSEGKCREMTSAVLRNTIGFDVEIAQRNILYFRLKRKYRPFISSSLIRQSTYKRGGGLENIIWWLWLQGEDKAPEICKACLRSLRRWHSDKKIIILNENNISDYITIPDYITKKYEQGCFSRTHYSDIIRLQLLTEYGGTWIDSTVYCTGHNFPDVMHLPLFVFQMNLYSLNASTWFIVSEANNPIITLTRDLLFQYWKDYNHVDDRWFLFHMFFKMATEAYPDEWAKVPYFASGMDGTPRAMKISMFEDYSEEKMKHLADGSDFHKLSYKFNPDKLTPSSILQHIIDS